MMDGLIGLAFFALAYWEALVKRLAQLLACPLFLLWRV